MGVGGIDVKITVFFLFRPHRVALRQCNSYLKFLEDKGLRKCQDTRVEPQYNVTLCYTDSHTDTHVRVMSHGS